MYGSRKPHHGRYSVCYIYDIGYDETDNEFIRDEIANISEHLEELDWMNLSVRNPNVPAFPLKTSFMSTYEKYLPVNKTRTQYTRNIMPVRKATNHISSARDLSSIKSQEELDSLYNELLDSLTASEHELITACKMVMILPSEYYGNGSYDKWIRVCWALENTSPDLLTAWVNSGVHKALLSDFRILLWNVFKSGMKQKFRGRRIDDWFYLSLGKDQQSNRIQRNCESVYLC